MLSAPKAPQDGGFIKPCDQVVARNTYGHHVSSMSLKLLIKLSSTHAPQDGGVISTPCDQVVARNTTDITHISPVPTLHKMAVLSALPVMVARNTYG